MLAYFDNGNHRNMNYQSDKFWQQWGERWDLLGQITLKGCDIWRLEWTQYMCWGFLQPHKYVWSKKKKKPLGLWPPTRWPRGPAPSGLTAVKDSIFFFCFFFNEKRYDKYLLKKSLKKMIFFSCAMVFYLAKHWKCFVFFFKCFC